MQVVTFFDDDEGDGFTVPRSGLGVAFDHISDAIDAAAAGAELHFRFEVREMTEAEFDALKEHA